MNYIEIMMPRILYWACLITRSDYDLALESNRMDRLTIIFQAITLLLVTGIACLAWSAFWCSFLNPVVGMLLGLVVAACIFLLDQAMGASDWELAGVLRQPAHAVGNNGRVNYHWWGRLGLRVGISMILAQATAVGVMLWMFQGAIDSHNQKKRVLANSAVEKEYNTRKDELKLRLISPLEQEIALRAEESKALLNSIKNATEQRSEAAKQVSMARIEAEREHEGGLKNYFKGDGPLYREAKRQEAEAGRIGASADAEVAAAEARMHQLNQELEIKRKDLSAVNEKFSAGCREIDNQKVADSRWERETGDPLSRYIGLIEIKESPKYGAAAREFSWLMNLVLVTLELIFLTIKMVFAPASVYTVRLIARTKLEAARESARFARGLDENNRNRPRGGLRVVGGLDAEANRPRQNPEDRA